MVGLGGEVVRGEMGSVEEVTSGNCCTWGCGQFAGAVGSEQKELGASADVVVEAVVLQLQKLGLELLCCSWNCVWGCRSGNGIKGDWEYGMMGCITALGCSPALATPCTVCEEDKMSGSFEQIPVPCGHLDGVSEPS